MKANDLHNFRFEYAGSGCVRVTYVTEKRGDYWSAYIHDMGIIDATKNAEWAKAKDIEWLRYLVIHQGAHYSYNGKRLDK
jgi:hypothetical protein